MSSDNSLSIDSVITLTNQVYKNTDDIEEIKRKLNIVMDNFIDPSKFKHYLILDGHKIESDVAYQEIYTLAKYSINVLQKFHLDYFVYMFKLDIILRSIFSTSSGKYYHEITKCDLINLDRI